jgi:hypothetical protein
MPEVRLDRPNITLYHEASFDTSQLVQLINRSSNLKAHDEECLFSFSMFFRASFSYEDIYRNLDWQDDLRTTQWLGL